MACIMYTAQLGKWIHEYFEDSINLDKLDNSTRAVDLQGKKRLDGYLRVGEV